MVIRDNTRKKKKKEYEKRGEKWKRRRIIR